MIFSFPCPTCQAPVRGETGGLKRRMVNCPACNASCQVPDNVPIAAGMTIGNGYKLERKLHDSSLGEQYLATDKNNRQVSVEVLSGETSKDQEKVSRLMQEIELVASLKHDNIVEAIEAGQDGEAYFLVTAFESGKNLDEILDAGPVEEKLALSYVAGIAKALQYAWESKKILHRDIKPANVFITDSGKAKLAGFGIAKSKEGQSLGLTGVGFTIGTAEYMSPEQIRAQEDLDFRADMYSLGILLYECLTGKLPFEDKAPIVLMQKHMDEIPVPANEVNDKVSEEASAVADKMLQKDRSDRQGSWAELIGELEGIISGAGIPVKAAPVQASGPMPPPRPGQAAAAAEGKSKTGLIIGIGVVVVIIIVVVLAMVMKK
jgi:eukaryotic-like serine/threonine-protein kinase